jgi:hypothetical protein
MIHDVHDEINLFLSLRKMKILHPIRRMITALRVRNQACGYFFQEGE